MQGKEICVESSAKGFRMARINRSIESRASPRHAGKHKHARYMYVLRRAFGRTLIDVSNYCASAAPPRAECRDTFDVVAPRIFREMAQPAHCCGLHFGFAGFGMP